MGTEIERLKQQLAEKDAEIERLKASWQSVAIEDMVKQLAASQAREVQLREALIVAHKALEAIGNEMTVGDRYTNAGQYLIDSLEPSREALSLSQDTSALESMIAKSGEVMRERWLRSFDLSGLGNAEMIRPQDIVKTIRALPGVTLEDLQK